MIATSLSRNRCMVWWWVRPDGSIEPLQQQVDRVFVCGLRPMNMRWSNWLRLVRVERARWDDPFSLENDSQFEQ